MESDVVPHLIDVEVVLAHLAREVLGGSHDLHSLGGADETSGVIADNSGYFHLSSELGQHVEAVVSDAALLGWERAPPRDM
jgi:hypothetical protein